MLLIMDYDSSKNSRLNIFAQINMSFDIDFVLIIRSDKNVINEIQV